MTTAATSAVRARASVILAVVMVMVMVMVTGACTPGAPVAAPGATSRTATGDQNLFPLVRDTPSDEGTTVRRVGFVDRSGQVVVRPTYRAYRVCPATDGTDVILAWGGGRLDALDTAGQTVGTLASTLASTGASTETSTATSTPEADADIDARSAACGPLPGYATVSTDQETSVVALPDLTASDLPVGVALDASVIWVPAAEQSGRDTAPYLYDATTRSTTTLPSDAVSLVLADGERSQAGTGEWPVPVLDAKGKQRYLDKTGAWASTQSFVRAGGFVNGHGGVSTGPSSWFFVDTTLTKTGRDYTSIIPLLAADGTVVGYQVTTTAGGASTGLVTTDLEVVVDPDTESATCTESTTCVAHATDGTARLVVLPEGTSTALPEAMTTALSDRLVTDAAGSTVYNLTTGQTFDVPAPYRAEAAWADAYVVATSDNGLRMVLDGSGEATSLGTITGQVTADDGTMYFWATTGSRQGYVDAAGDWLYDEARHTALED